MGTQAGPLPVGLAGGGRIQEGAAHVSATIFTTLKILGLSTSGARCRPIEPNCRSGAIARVLGTTDRLLVHVVNAAGKRFLSGTGFGNCRIARVSSPA